MRSSKLISGYIARAALPYVLLALLLLTTVLFVQQAGRFAELALYVQIPVAVLSQLGAALLPSVLILTLPVAVLAGVVIGFARMGSDSEIVAMRAAGIGTWSMLWPALLIGLLVTGATTYIQMVEAPRAARDLKRVAVQGALRKLESPVDPRTFNTEIPRNVIYVRDGNKVTGAWGRVFIYSQQPDGAVAVVTARSGRIDSSGNISELVLSDAVRTKIPAAGGSDQGSYVVERLDQLRISIDTGRAELIQQLNREKPEPEELDWTDLRQKARSEVPAERAEGQRIMQRKLALSASPFLFALFGAALGLRIRRGGRGIGVLLALAIVVVYYLVSLLGESLARSGTVSAVLGGWAASALMLSFGLVLLTVHQLPSIPWPSSGTKKTRAATPQVNARGVRPAHT
ncbi:MAG: LptF/LptG family permease, partial [Acidobacteriota bacterium]